MRRKQQIQALQQELALLRQTVDSGKELAALAADAAGQLRKPSLRTVAVQVMKTPRVRRAALIAGGTVAAAALGAAAVHCRVYRVIVAQEVKKALKPVSARLDALQATVDAVAEAEGVAPDKAHKSNQHGRGRHAKKLRFRSETELFYMVFVVSTCDQVRPNAAARPGDARTVVLWNTAALVMAARRRHRNVLTNKIIRNNKTGSPEGDPAETVGKPCGFPAERRAACGRHTLYGFFTCSRG